MGGFFVLLLSLGVWLHNDYGISWDEPNNHLNGLVSAKYLAQLVAPARMVQQPELARIPDLRAFRDADHGVAFELPLTLLGALLTPHDSQGYYRLRHLSVFLVFVGGVWALYQLARQRFGHRGWGLLAAGLLVLSSRFFAEAFYNGKDIVYMAFFTLAIYTLTRLLRRPTPSRALVHGLTTALAVDIRVQGLLLVLITMLLLALEAAYQLRWRWAQFGRVGVLYIVAALSLTVLGWPYLWALSWQELLHATERIGRYPWPGQVIYFGERVLASELPWHYLPVWITITTPLPYIIASLVGLAFWMKELVRHGRAYLCSFERRLDLLFVMWLLVPALLVIGLRSVLYDGWRHLYFIYPALLLFTVHAAWRMSQIAQRWPHWRPVALTLGLVGGLGMLHSAWRIIHDHPHQQLYFSILPPDYVQRNFDLDYWGLSYRRGLEWLLIHDPAPVIHVSVNIPQPPVDIPYGEHLLYVNSLILPPKDRARLRFSNDNADADYTLTTYRYQAQPFPDTIGQEVHTIRVNGIRILSVFRRSDK